MVGELLNTAVVPVPVTAMAAVLALGTANNVEVEFGDYTVKISKD